MQMTKQQFDTAVESLQQGVCDSELDARVFTGALAHELGICPDDAEETT